MKSIRRWTIYLCALMALLATVAVPSAAHASIANFYQSGTISASGAEGIATADLPYGPETGLCGPVIFELHATPLGIDDTDGSQSTGVTVTTNPNGTWHVTARSILAGDSVSIAYACLPFTSFNHGVPTRTGLAVVSSFGAGLKTNSADNPWTTVFVPMGFWGSFLNVTHNVMPNTVVQGDYAGIALCPGLGGSICGMVNSATWAAPTVEGMQYAGYSWSPTTCSFSLGRMSSGSCLYVPNFGNTSDTLPASPCEECGFQPWTDGNALAPSCSPDQNLTQCPGAGNAISFLTSILGGFTVSTSHVGITQQVSGFPTTLTAGGSTTVPAPGAALGSVEDLF